MKVLWVPLCGWWTATSKFNAYRPCASFSHGGGVGAATGVAEARRIRILPPARTSAQRPNARSCPSGALRKRPARRRCGAHIARMPPQPHRTHADSVPSRLSWLVIEDLNFIVQITIISLDCIVSVVNIIVAQL